MGSATSSCKINGNEVELHENGNFSSIQKLKLGENKFKIEIDGEEEVRLIVGEKAKVTKPVAFGQHYESFPPEKSDKKNILRSILVAKDQIRIPLNVAPIYQLEKHGSHKLVLDLADIEMELDWIHYQDPDCPIIIGEVIESKFPIIFTAPIESYQEKWEDDCLILDITYKKIDFNVCIDPGHGGKSNGSVSPKGLCEKDVNLSISHKIKAELDKLGVNSVMTRDDDRFVSLEGRVHLAQDYDCDIILSIHHNALPDARDPEKERGLSCHYYHEQSKPFAKYLLDKLVEYTELPYYGLFRQNLHVLREASDTRSVLVELGYLIHPEESEIISNEEHQNNVARIIAKAVYNFFVKSGMAEASSNGNSAKS